MKKELANLEQALKHHEEEQMVQRRGMQEEWEKAIRESNVLMIIWTENPNSYTQSGSKCLVCAFRLTKSTPLVIFHLIP